MNLINLWVIIGWKWNQYVLKKIINKIIIINNFRVIFNNQIIDEN